MSARSLGRLLAAAAAVWVAGCAAEAPPPAPAAEQAVLIRTELPAREDVVDSAVLPADLLAARRAVLAAEVAGTVEQLPVDEGQTVAAGQLIAAVDERAVRQQLAEAEALDRQAQAQHKRAQALFEKRSITQQQLLDAITNRDVAEARLASARLALDKARVRAPWAGQVAAKRVEVGDYAVPGQPLVELVDGATLKVRAPAPAADVPYLEVGAPVVIRVDALPGEIFEGRVARLAAELDPSARTLDVEAEIANPDGRLKPGMFARMEIPLRRLPGALLVPLGALVDLAEGRALFVAEEGSAVRRDVELGPVVGARVVVESGLRADEAVIVDGAQRVADGQRVVEAESGAGGASAPAGAGGAAAGGTAR